MIASVATKLDDRTSTKAICVNDICRVLLFLLKHTMKYNAKTMPLSQGNAFVAKRYLCRKLNYDGLSADLIISRGILNISFFDIYFFCFP